MKIDLKEFLFPKKSQWHDIGMFEVSMSGRYILIQMRYNLSNNKKQFRRSSMGFVNDYSVKGLLFKAVLDFGKGI